jgi:hypothetical protein
MNEPIIITQAQLDAITKLVTATRAALDELDRRDGPICPPGDVRHQLRAALKAVAGSG